MRLITIAFVVIVLAVTGCQSVTKKADPPVRVEAGQVKQPVEGPALVQSTSTAVDEQIHAARVSAIAVPTHQKASKSSGLKSRHVRNSAADERAKAIWSLSAEERLKWANSELRKRGIDVPDSEQ